MALAAQHPPRLRTVNSETCMAVGLLAALRASDPAPAAPSSASTASDLSAASSLSSLPPSLASPSKRARVPSPFPSPSLAVASTAAAAARSPTSQAAYSRAERAAALARFREKKRLRSFKKRIRYDVRKRLADTRPRYKGRFSKPPKGEKYDDGTVAE